MRARPDRTLRARPPWVVLLGASVTVALSLLIGWAAWGIDQADDRRSDVDRLEQMLGAVTVLDESMTRATRMAAVTEDMEWEERYDEIAHEVDLRIRRMVSLSTLVDGEATVVRLRAASRRMTFLERKAFGLVREGQSGAALQLISSEAYNEQKAMFSEAVDELAAAAAERVRAYSRSVEQRILWGGLLAGLGAIALLGLWGTVFRQLHRHLTARAHSLSLLQTTLDSTAEGVLAVDHGGRTLSYNRRFPKMWRIPDDVVRTRDEDALVAQMAEQLEDAGTFCAGLQTELADDTNSHFDVLKLKDGRVFERYSRPQRLGEEVVGRVFSFRDVTERVRAEEALRVSEERFRGAYEHAPIGMALNAPDGTWIDVNAALCATVGYSEEELLEKTFQEITHPEDLEQALRNMRRLLEGEIESYRMEKRYLHKDGHVVWVWLTVSLVRSSTGEPLYFIAQVQDISERKRMEAALAEGEERYRQLFERSPMGVYRTKPSGEIVAANPAMARMLGYDSVEELAAYDVSEYGYAAPEDRDRFLAAMEQDGRVSGLEAVWRRRDGTNLHVRENARTVRADDGTLLYFEGTVEDVTDRVQAAEALRESEAHLREVTDGVRAIIWECDADTWEITYISSGVEEILGYPPEQWYEDADLWANTIHPDDRERVVQACVDAIEACRDSVLEYRSVTSDGRTVWLRDVIHIVTDGEGKAERLRGVMTDITQVKALEEKLLQSQKLEAVGQLAGGIAHEFNNLLTVILGHTQFLLDDLTSGDPLRADAEEIDKAAGRARDLTSQLLAFGRRQILRSRTLDLNAVVAGLKPMLRRLLHEDVEVSTRLTPDAATVEADPGKIEQVIVTLALNARDAMPDGGRFTIEVSSIEPGTGDDRLDLSPGRYVCLTLSDTGTGMGRETQEHIFEPFFTTREQGKGTGLGLASVYGIVKQAGGDIAVQSLPGAGSTFRIYLPAVEVAPTAEEVAPARPDGSGTKTVLVVEDEDAVRALVRRVLERDGYVVLEAENGRAGLRVFLDQAEAVDLVVTDVIMPVMDGRRLVEQLRNEQPDLPVIYMSGHTEDAAVHRGIADGDAFLAKPFEPTELVRRVREVLGVDKGQGEKG